LHRGIDETLRGLGLRDVRDDRERLARHLPLRVAERLLYPRADHDLRALARERQRRRAPEALRRRRDERDLAVESEIHLAPFPARSLALSWETGESDAGPYPVRVTSGTVVPRGGRLQLLAVLAVLVSIVALVGRDATT